ncbi:MAG: hypothetical protein CW338_07475 [Clostridiales bacterium]|nr:hypothetical protein [Clostridiales bacterium]
MKKLLSFVTVIVMLFSVCCFAAAEDEVKTGLYVDVNMTGSKAATENKNGTASIEYTMVAVAVDADNVITDAVIDMIQVKVGITAEGKLTVDAATTTFASKNELKDNYGMRAASSIGREWFEQMEGLCEYVIGKKVDELKGIALTEQGKAADADLAATVTLSIAGYIDAIIAAAENADYHGAVKGDKLYLTQVTGISKSKDATENKDGQVQGYTFFGVITKNGDTVTSCYIDAAQPTVKFDAAGALTSDLTAAVQTKNQLGDGYGMRRASSIGKEWNEQAAAFCQYVTGKTVAEITGISVNDDGKTDDADITAFATVSIAEMIELITKTVE